MIPSVRADREPDARRGVERAHALGEQLGDAAPHQRAGAGQRSVPSRSTDGISTK
jgi:hypothetical protein